MSSTQPPKQNSAKGTRQSGLFSKLDSADAAILKKAAFAVIGLWCATPILLCLSLTTWAERGTFGDLFGSINALFSGLALLGIIATILLQQKELSLSTQELRNSAKALQKQVELAADTSRLQVLPTLIQTQKTRIKSIDQIYGGHEFNGIEEQDYNADVVREVIERLRASIERAPSDLEDIRSKLAQAPSSVYGSLQKDSREDCHKQIANCERRLKRDTLLKPEMELMLQYILDSSSLYSKISDTKLDD